MLHKRSIKEKLLKGSAWAFSGKIVTAFSSLVVNALLTRLLTPEEVGVYFLTLSLVSVAAVITQLGLTQTIVRLVAESMGIEKPSRARRSVLLVLRMIATSGLFVAGILIFGGGVWIAEKVFHSEVMASVIGLAVVWMILVSFQSLISEIFRGFHDIRLATIFGGLVTSIISMLLFFVIWILQVDSDLNQIMLLTLVGGGSSVALSSLLLWKKLKILPRSVDEEINTSKILHISLPLWITNLTLLALLQADLWIMGIFLTAEDVAIYGAAARLIALIAMPLLIINAVLPPIISEMSAQNKIKDLEKILRSAATLTGLPAFVVVGIFIISGDFILHLLYGEYYRAGATVLAILALGQLVNVLAGSCGQVLMLSGHQTTMMVITIISGLFTIITAWYLVQSYGGTGVASAACIGMILQNILMLFYAKKTVGVWTHFNPLLIKNAKNLL